MKRSLILLTAAAALGLRLWHLNGALWYDEAYSAWLAALPLPRLLAATLADVHPPGYYLLLWALNSIMGNTEIVLRLPSLLAGLGLIAVVHYLGIALGLPARAVWLATAITALAPFQVYYSQEARAYSLLSALIALAALWLWQNKPWPAVLAAVGALWLHNMAALFVVSLFAAGWLSGRRPGKWPLLTLLAGLLAQAGFALRQAGQMTGDYWIPPLTSPGRLLATMDDLLWFAPNNPFVLATGLLTALGLLLLAFDYKFWLFTSRGRFLAIMSLGPLAIVALASLIWQPVLISRVVAPSAPFYYLWLARAVTASPRRLLVWAPAAALTAALTLAALAYNGRPLVDNVLVSEMAQGEAIYHANVGSYVVWKYYLPHKPQYVWPQNTTLGQTLSGPTRLAMGMNEIEFSRVQCAAKNWRLIYFHNPTTTPPEIEYVTALTSAYPSSKIRQLRSDSTVDAAIVSLAPNCP